MSPHARQNPQNFTARGNLIGRLSDSQGGKWTREHSLPCRRPGNSLREGAGPACTHEQRQGLGEVAPGPGWRFPAADLMCTVKLHGNRGVPAGAGGTDEQGSTGTTVRAGWRHQRELAWLCTDGSAQTSSQMGTCAAQDTVLSLSADTRRRRYLRRPQAPGPRSQFLKLFPSRGRWIRGEMADARTGNRRPAWSICSARKQK